MLTASGINDTISVRLAQNAAEIEAAQRLRYQVFYREQAAIPDAEAARTGIDRDDYDRYAEHLIVIDESMNDRIVGTYRLLREKNAARCGQFYTSNEFDIAKLWKSGASLLELGRSCVLREYRTGAVMQLLWQGIADYVAEHNIDMMFGCASLQGTNVQKLAVPLSYLHHYHLTPESIRPCALESRYIDINLVPLESLNPREAFSLLPPLLKGYLRLGGTIGDGAVIDKQFGTTDVCLVVQTHLVTERYRKHYERNKTKRQETSSGDDVIPLSGFTGSAG